MELKKKMTLVVDFDDVLVEMTPMLYSAIRKNWRAFSKYFIDLGPLRGKDLYERNEFYMNKWLLKPSAALLSEDEQKEIDRKTFSMFLKYFFDKDPYKMAKPTNLALQTLCNPLFMDNNFVEKVYIISRNVSKIQDESKKRFIEKYFNHEKISYLSVDKIHSKAEEMLEKNINWGLFIDDEISNIKSVAEKFDLKGREFLIPRFGYNKMLEDLDLLIKGKGGVYNYYDPYNEVKTEKEEKE